MPGLDRNYYVVDAFSTGPFTGNPAAVVCDAAGLDDDTMRRIAAEFNLSETTFFLPPKISHSDPEVDLSVRIRWFTPTVEVDMCGHATVAGVHALVESGRLPTPTSEASCVVRIETKSGVLTAYVEHFPGASHNRIIWLELRPPRLEPVRVDLPGFASALGLLPGDLDAELPPSTTQDHDLLLFARDISCVNGAQPDFAVLARLLRAERCRGLCLATTRTLTPSITVQSRFFAPTVGINEDPVTGSVHGPLAAYLARLGQIPRHDGVSALRCVQGTPGGRAGLLYAIVRETDSGDLVVRVGGHACTTMIGRLVLSDGLDPSKSSGRA
ncbi:MAG: PhzF family phenazine biosynthesis protein [Planctomycetota bacterium]